MDIIRITGVPGIDGDYPIDVTYFTNRELHKIKQLSGVRAGEIKEAFSAGDNDVIVAIAVIAMMRNGKPEQLGEALWDAPSGGIELIDDPNAEKDEEQIEEEKLPPRSGLAVLPSEPEKNDSSGLSSDEPSEQPASDPSRTGQPDSAISAESA